MVHILDEHRHYVADQVRVQAFQQAISEVVRPGDVVLDLGAGTGILGLLACRVGAKRVYAIDRGVMLDVARQLCRANGFHEKMVFLKGLSTQLRLPEQVDVVVADQIGGFGFDAGVLEYYADARQRFLRPQGVMIPSHCELYATPVTCPEMFARVEFWQEAPGGFDFSPVRSLAVNTSYHTSFGREQLLGEPTLLDTLDFATASDAPINAEGTIVVQQAGVMHGLGGWFVAQLSPNVRMTNIPQTDNSIQRLALYLPIDQPVSLRPGDRVHIKMHIIPSELLITWKVIVWDQGSQQHHSPGNGNKGTFTHSTWKGPLISTDDLRKTQPNFVPRLSPWGEAHLSVLRLCEGERSRADIERELLRCHPELFPSLDVAAKFITQVITQLIR